MDEITEVRRRLDPPSGLRPDTAQEARRRLMLAATTMPRSPSRWRHGLIPLAVTTAGAAAAVAAAAVTGPGRGAQPATLTAWTVARAADHSVTVTIREYRYPQKLQQILTAAGVPALVQSGAGSCPYAYQAIPGNASLIGQVVTRDVRSASSLAVFTIHPGAIPAGAQLDIVFPGTAKPGPAGSAQAAPVSSPSPAAGPRGSIAHPVSIRLIAASQPVCAGPSPGPSPS